MKKLLSWWVLLFIGVLSFGSFVAEAVGEGEIAGCGGDGVDCKVCIEDTLRRAKEQVAEEELPSGNDASSNTEDR